MNRWLSALFIIAAASGISVVQAANYTITVNAAVSTGSWNRFYERGVASDHMHTFISSAYGRNACNALKKAHSEAGFQYVRGHGLFDDDDSVYSEDASGNAVYAWTSVDKIYDSMVAAGMRPLVEMDYMPNKLASAQSWINSVWYNGFDGNWNAPKDWNKWKAFIQAFLAHLESRYGQAEIRNNWMFVLWNEPNWCYGGGGGDNGWMTLYDSTSVAFKAQDSLVRLGGPDEGGGTSLTLLPTLIQHCRTYNRKLDLVDYHEYANNASGNCNAMGVNAFHKQIVDSCKKYKFTGIIANTEMGPSFTQSLPCHDNNQGASYLAKIILLLNANDTIAYPPPYVYSWWTISDIYEETNNTTASAAFCGNYGLLTRGVASIPQSWDIEKPSFNAYRLLHKLGATTVSCTGGTTASPGVNAVATMSATQDTLSVLIYNHVDATTGNSATTDSVTLTISGIPFTSAHEEHFLIDSTHSNAYTAWIGLNKPASPTAAQYTTISNAAQLGHYDSVTTVPITGGTFTKKFAQRYYSVALLQLTNSAVAVRPAPITPLRPTLLSATVDGATLRLVLPAGERFSVRLLAANGRSVLKSRVAGGKAATISLAKVPAGSYVLECVGSAGKMVKKVMVGM
jgi:xylan 1,4-beta-xylosidase